MRDDTPAPNERILDVILKALEEDRVYLASLEDGADEKGDSGTLDDAPDPTSRNLSDREYFEGVAPHLRAALSRKETVAALLQGKFRTATSSTLESFGQGRLTKRQTHLHGVFHELVAGQLEHDVAAEILIPLQGFLSRLFDLAENSPALLDADVPEMIASPLWECSRLHLLGAFSACVVFAASTIEGALARALPEGRVESLEREKKLTLSELLREAKDRDLLPKASIDALGALRILRNSVVHKQIACTQNQSFEALKAMGGALRLLRNASTFRSDP